MTYAGGLAVAVGVSMLCGDGESFSKKGSGGLGNEEKG